MIGCALVFRDVIFDLDEDERRLNDATAYFVLSVYMNILICLYDIIYVGLIPPHAWMASIWFVVGAAVCGKVK